MYSHLNIWSSVLHVVRDEERNFYHNLANYPRTGDVYGLSGLILSAALLSPQTPNKLLLGYLDHALATQTVSHAAVLQAVAAFNDGKQESPSTKKGPFCLQALLNLAQLSLNHVTAKGKPEECLNLSISILKTLHWLLKIVHQVLLFTK